MLRRLLAFFCCWLLIAPAWAVNEKQVRALFWHGQIPLTQLGTVSNLILPASGTAAQYTYVAPGAGITALTTNTSFGTLITSSGTISNLVAGSAGNADNGTVTITLMKNTVAQSLTCPLTISNAGTLTQCLDTNPTHALNVVPGDILVWRLTTTQAAWNSLNNVTISWTFKSTNGQNGTLWTGSGSSAAGTGATAAYFGPGTQGANATESAITGIAPSDGYINGFRVVLNAADSGANFHTFYLCHNSAAGACTSSPLTCNTSVTPFTGCVATGAPIHIAPTDTFSIEDVGTASATAKFTQIAINWQASVPGQSPVFLYSTAAPPNTTTYYPLTGAAGGNTTEGSAWSMTSQFPTSLTISNMYFFIPVSHTAGKSRTLTLKAAATPFPTATTATTPLHCLNSGTATAGGGNGFNAGGGNLTGILCADLADQVNLPAAAFADWAISVVATDSGSAYHGSYIAVIR